MHRIVESKRAFRKKLAALPIAEKLRMMDALRANAMAIRGKSSRPVSSVHEPLAAYGKRLKAEG